MKRQITAIVTCFALALSGMAGTAVEAKSKKNNVVPLILGAAALGLLLNEMNKGKAQATVPTRGYSPYDDDYSDYFNPAPKPNRSRVVPAECLFEVNVNGKGRQVVSQRCMTELGMAKQLPAECAFDIRTYSGKRTVYGERCLRDYGYRIETAQY